MVFYVPFQVYDATTNEIFDIVEPFLEEEGALEFHEALTNAQYNEKESLNMAAKYVPYGAVTNVFHVYGVDSHHMEA